MKLHNMSAAALLAEPMFPRISPDEELIIRDWLLQYSHLYESFSIDVPIARYASSDAPAGDWIDRMWANITRRRIDVVAIAVDRVDVVEAKVHATMPTATQVRSYCDALARVDARCRRIRPVIICRTSTIGVAAVMLQCAGRLIEVQPTDARDAGGRAHFV